MCSVIKLTQAETLDSGINPSIAMESCSLCWAKTVNVRGYVKGQPMPVRGVVQKARSVCGLALKQSTNYVTYMQEVACVIN